MATHNYEMFYFTQSIIRFQNLSSFGIWQSRNYLTSNTKWTIKAHLTRFPVIMRIHDSPQFIDCMTKEVLMLRNMFTENGHEIRIVGGAVR